MRKNTKLELKDAMSVYNGIMFFSEKNIGYVAGAFINKKGKIIAGWDKNEKSEKIKKAKNKAKEKQSLLENIIGILFLYLALNKLPIIVQIIAISNLLQIFYDFVTDHKKDTWAQKVSRNKFHSAEHMIANAYKELGRVPSIKELKNFSRFNNSCGTTQKATEIIEWTIIFICGFSFFKPLIATIIIVVTNNLLSVLTKLGFLNFFQIIDTRKPSDRELSIAITGFRIWLENESK